VVVLGVLEVVLEVLLDGPDRALDGVDGADDEITPRSLLRSPKKSPMPAPTTAAMATTRTAIRRPGPDGTSGRPRPSGSCVGGNSNPGDDIDDHLSGRLLERGWPAPRR
jgi:hypothetical protein